MKNAVLTAVYGVTIFSGIGEASTITQTEYVEDSIAQTGRYGIDVSIRRRSSQGWRWRTPDLGGGVNWNNWSVAFNDLPIPEGSTLNSVLLSWNRTLWDTSWHWDNRPQDFSCNTGSSCVGSTVDSVSVDASSNLVFVESAGVRHWFPVPEPYAPSGQLNLLAMGFGDEILSSRQVALLGALRISLGRVYLNEGWNPHNEFDWQGLARMGMAVTLTLDFTAPEVDFPESTTPEPSSLVLLGCGLAAIFVGNWKRRP